MSTKPGSNQIIHAGQALNEWLDSNVDTELRADLVSGDVGKGAWLIAYKLSAIGSVVRNLNVFLDDLGVFPSMFGAVGDGVADDTSAIQAAINWAPAYSTVYLGVHKVSATLRVRRGAIRLAGYGSSVSELVRDTDYGDTITVGRNDPATESRISGVGLSGFSIKMNAEMSTGSHIRIRDTFGVSSSDITLWNGFVSLLLEGVQNSVFDRLIIKSGEYYAATKTNSCFVIIRDANRPDGETGEVFFSNFNWTRTGSIDTPIHFGLRVEACDGVWFSNGHVFGASTTLRINPQTGSTQLVGCHFDQVWFDQKTAKHVSIGGSSTEGYGEIFFNNCKGLNASQSSIEIAAGSNVKGVYFNGGEWSKLASDADSSPVVDFAGGSRIRMNGVDSRLNVPSATNLPVVGVNVMGAVKDFTVTGGSVISSSDVVKITDGISITESTVNGISIVGTRFENCSNEISLFGPLREYSKISNITTNRTGMDQITGAATIAPPVVCDSIDIVTTPATVTDISNGWEGRRLLIRSNGITTTFAHNTGTAGTKTVTSTGTPIVLTTGKYATAVYHRQAGVWFIQA